MAQKYRKIDPRIWDDEKFGALQPAEQLVALYLLTTPQSNRIGIFKFSPAMGAEALKMMPETFAEHFGRVLAALAWRFDPRARVLYLPTWWKYNPPENPNVVKGNLEDLHDLPQTPLFDEFASNTRHLAANVAQTFRETLRKRYSLTGTMFAESGAGAGAGAGAELNTAEPPLFAATSAATATGDDETEVVLTFDCVAGRREKSREWALTRGKLAEYSQTFPGVDVETEARKAWQFARDNPARKPTAEGCPNFLRRWLSTAQNQSAARNLPRAQTGAPSRSDARRERLERAVQ